MNTDIKHSLSDIGYDDNIICPICGFTGTIEEFINEMGIEVCPKCGNLMEEYE